jgi:hypothetical protein
MQNYYYFFNEFEVLTVSENKHKRRIKNIFKASLFPIILNECELLLSRY